jgi:hypothetical protein
MFPWFHVLCDMLLSLGKLVFWIQALAPEIRHPEVKKMREDSEERVDLLREGLRLAALRLL